MSRSNSGYAGLVITITAFAWVPPVIQGFVRDYRVRWALEEAGLPYQVKLVALGEQKAPEYRALQPFGQVPALIDGDLVMFETGAIVQHIAAGSPALMPADPADRARVATWIFAALSSIEPFVLGYGETPPNTSWEPVARQRVAQLGDVLSDREHLVADRFTAADLMMASVLRVLHSGDLLARVPAVEAYVARCTARPAFQKAIADQLAGFAEHAPPS